MLSKREPPLSPAQQLQLRIAQSLRGTRIVAEELADSLDRQCVICTRSLADGLSTDQHPYAHAFSTADKQHWICSGCFRQFHAIAGWRVESPFRRNLRLPVTTDQLHPLDPRCRIVQLNLVPAAPLNEADFQLVAGFLSQYPQIPFRVYGAHPAVKDLEFLRHFRFIRQFQADIWDLASFEGLRFLPCDLEALGLGSTKSKRHSLRPLERFSALKQLFLNGHSKHVEIVGGFAELEGLSLRSVTLPDLSCLASLTHLESLEIRLGGTKDLRLLPSIGKLRYLELWLIRGLSDLSSIGELEHLQYLVLESLRQVTALPSFRKLRSLRRVRLLNMKGIRDLSAIAEAPALEGLFACEMRQLAPEAFRPFLGHPALRAVSVGLGSFRKNAAVHSLLGLPPLEGRFEFSAEEGE